MKLSTPILAYFLLVIAGFTFLACDKNPDPEPPIEEVQLGKLVSTWKVSEVKLDDVSKKTDYNNFQLVISGTAGATSFGYSVSGRPTNSPWPASGTWTFGANPETQIVRDAGNDKLDITYAISSDGNQLQLNFDFGGAGYPARTSNVKGKWVFTFTK